MTRGVYMVVAIVIAFAVGIGLGYGLWGGVGGISTTTINEGGSTTVAPLAEKWASAYEAEFPFVDITVSSVGSTAGVNGVLDGTFDLGAASRDLKDSETASGAVGHAVAKDGVAIVVDADATHGITQLTLEQVRNIFNGSYTNWSQLGGSDMAITVFSREAGSGTRETFEHLVMAGDQVTADHIEVGSNPEMKVKVSQAPGGIGYLSLGHVDETVTALAISEDGVNYVPCTVENCQNGTYPVTRRLYFVTKGEATGMVKNFIEWCQSPAGQQIVDDEGFIPLYSVP